MKRRKPVELIYFSQYVDILKMPSETAEEVRAKQFATGDFMSRLKTTADLCVFNAKKTTPASIKFLANEMLSMGENFMSQTLERHCIISATTKMKVIDINSILVVLRMLGFNSSQADRAELRTWLLNNRCFAEGPNFLEKHIIFIDSKRFVKAMKEYKNEEFSMNYYGNNASYKTLNS